MRAHRRLRLKQQLLGAQGEVSSLKTELETAKRKAEDAAGTRKRQRTDGDGQAVANLLQQLQQHQQRQQLQQALQQNSLSSLTSPVGVPQSNMGGALGASRPGCEAGTPAQRGGQSAPQLLQALNVLASVVGN